MADTHINAFFADVDVATKELEQAQAKLAEANTRLETKKKEVGYVEEEASAKYEKPLPNLDKSEEYKKFNRK